MVSYSSASAIDRAFTAAAKLRDEGQAYSDALAPAVNMVKERVKRDRAALVIRKSQVLAQDAELGLTPQLHRSVKPI